MDLSEWDYGARVPGVECPECRGELVTTEHGAFCDWCASYVPVIGTPVVLDDGDDQDDEDNENGDEW